VNFSTQATFTLREQPQAPKKNAQDSFLEAAKQRMAEAKAGKAKMSNVAQPTMKNIRLVKQRTCQRRSARTQDTEQENVTR
jgi:hypothetical protein